MSTLQRARGLQPGLLYHGFSGKYWSEVPLLLQALEVLTSSPVWMLWSRDHTLRTTAQCSRDWAGKSCGCLAPVQSSRGCGGGWKGDRSLGIRSSQGAAMTVATQSKQHVPLFFRNDSRRDPDRVSSWLQRSRQPPAPPFHSPLPCTHCLDYGGLGLHKPFWIAACFLHQGLGCYHTHSVYFSS